MSNFNLAKVYYNLITGSQKESLVKQPMRRHPHKTLPGKYEEKKKRRLSSGNNIPRVEGTSDKVCSIHHLHFKNLKVAFAIPKLRRGCNIFAAFDTHVI